MLARMTAVLAFLLAPVMAFAQPVADKVPADAIVYVGWRGNADLGPGYAQSNLKAVLDDSSIPEFIDKFIPEVLDKVGQLNPQAGDIGKIVSAIGRPTWQHPTAFFFAGLDAAQGKPPTPHLGIIWEPGADADALAKQLEDLVAQAPAPFPIKMVHAGQLVALMVGYDNPETALAGGNTKALADDAAFKAALGHLTVKDPVAAVYVDYARLLEMMDGLIKQDGDEHAARQWPTVRDDLGLQGLKRLVGASGFDGKDYGTQAFLEAPEPRSGLLKLANGKPLGEEILAAIPKTATMAGAGRLEGSALYDILLKTASDAEPEAAKQFERFIAQIRQDSSVDLRADLLQSLGDEWAYYADPTIGGRGLASFTLVNRLKNPEKFEHSMAKIEDYALKQAQKEAGADVPVKIGFETVNVDGMTIHYLAVPLVAPSWVVQDGNLYVSLFPQVAAGAARHVAQKDPSIMKNEGVIALRQRLGQPNPASFTFMDLPKTAPDAYGAWLFVSRLAGIGDLFGVKSPPLIMPELNKLQQHLAPAGSVGWADADGFHMRSIEPFPGSTMVASDPAISALYLEPAMVATLLPALNRAREQANRVKSASNLRQIGQAAMMYANENKGNFPPDLKTIYKQVDLTPSVFINPRSDTAPPPPGTPDEMAAWVQEHGDYVWIGKGKNASSPADTVLAYEKLEDNPEGVNVLFADGHVEFLMIPHAQELIEKSKPAKVNGNL